MMHRFTAFVFLVLGISLSLQAADYVFDIPVEVWENERFVTIERVRLTSLETDFQSFAYIALAGFDANGNQVISRVFRFEGTTVQSFFNDPANGTKTRAETIIEPIFAALENTGRLPSGALE